MLHLVHTQPPQEFSQNTATVSSVGSVSSDDNTNTMTTPPHASSVTNSPNQQHTAQQSTMPLAIVGWANKFPGEATTAENFWKMLCEARTAHGRIPQDRFNVDAFYHPQSARTGSVVTTHGHFLSEDIGAFDAPFFSITPAEAATMDPQQRLTLETAYHALENAGIQIDSLRGSKTSVYIGSSTHDYSFLYARDPENAPKYLSTGLGASIIPNRVSWFFDLHGESVLVDTACSSSLTCLHLAAQSLRSGNSDMALVGGVQLIVNPDASMLFMSNMGFMNKDGRSYSFDARGNGFGKSEGGAVIIVKRLDDAVRDGDTIRAIVRATGVNQDGRTPGITQPSQAAQEANIRAIYRSHGLDPHKTHYVEAHGTGTQVGDPIEFAAISNVLGRSDSAPIYIGAVKANIGHLEAGAGIAGIVKTIMVLETGLIPPNALLKEKNPKINLKDSNLRFPTEVTPWPVDGLRRASVNSFGYGGTNAHAVLDDAFHYLQGHSLRAKHRTVEYPMTSHSMNIDGRDVETLPVDRESCLMKVFVWSAADEAAMKRMLKQFVEYLANPAVPVANQDIFLSRISYTLFKKRSNLAWKTSIIANSLEMLRGKLELHTSKPVRSSTPPRVLFTFTGQGAQWYAMGRELMCFSTFAESIHRSERLLNEVEGGFSVLEELLKDKSISRINEPLMSQTLCTVIQLALVDLLADWSVRPDVVLGHSSGEIAAAYCSGALSFESAVIIAFYRGLFADRLARSGTQKGAMISVSLSAEAIVPYLEEARAPDNGMLVIACENSPSNVTVSGDRACIERLNSLMEAQGIFARLLNVPLAYHSPHMEAAASYYRDSMQGKIDRKMDAPLSSYAGGPIMFSTVTGYQVSAEQLTSPGYWVGNMVSKVKFTTALMNLNAFVQTSVTDPSDSNRLFIVEVGPHAALKRLLQDNLATSSPGERPQYVSLLERNVSATITCLNAVGIMHCNAIRVDLEKANRPSSRLEEISMITDMPQYPFNHSRRYWEESRLSKNYRLRQVVRHELLGFPSTDWNLLEPHWRHFLKHSENPWMQDHTMGTAKLYSAAGMVVMAVEAARQMKSAENIAGYRLTNLQFMQPLRINTSNSGVEVQLRFHRPKGIGGDPSAEHDFSIYVLSGDTWIQCCTGAIIVELANDYSPYRFDGYRIKALHAQHRASIDGCVNSISKEAFYQNMAKYGCNFGPCHQVLDNIKYDGKTLKAASTIVMDTWLDKCDMQHDHFQPWVIHPTDLDGIIHLSLAAFKKGGTEAFPTMVATDCKSMWLSHELFNRPHGFQLNPVSRTIFSGFREADWTITAFDESEKPLVVIEEWRSMAVTNLATSQVSTTEAKRMFYSVKWDLDIDLAKPQTIHRLCEKRSANQPVFSSMTSEAELLILHCMRCVINLVAHTKDLKVDGTNLSAYLAWAHRCFDEARYQELMIGEGDRLVQDFTLEGAAVDNLSRTTSECPMVVGVWKHLIDTMRDKTDQGAFEPGKNLELLYQCRSLKLCLEKLETYVDLLAHKNPNLKVLDISTGTNIASAHLLDALIPRMADNSRSKLPRFTRYDLANLSAQDLASAKESLSEVAALIKFGILDIKKDPCDQGFAKNFYDLLFVGLGAHQTADVHTYLRNVRKLLSPGGKLVLIKLAPVNWEKSNLKSGFHISSWLATGANLSCEALLDIDVFDYILRQNGFSGVDLTLTDGYAEEEHLSSVVVTTAIETPAPAPAPDPIYTNSESIVIVYDSTSSLQSCVAQELSARLVDSSSVSISHATDIDPTLLIQKHCIVLRELDRPWLSKLNQQDLTTLQNITQSALDILWVTLGTGFSPTHPERDLATGFGRNVRSESYSVGFTHLELEESQDIVQIAGFVHTAFSKLLVTPNEKREDVYRVQDGQYHISRVHENNALNQIVFAKTSVHKPQPTTLGKEDGRTLSLSIGAPGLIDTLHFVDDESRETPLGDDEIEVRTAAVGINLRDILTALGRLSQKTFGSEFSGTVTKVGSHADLQIGDRVFGIASGSFKTHVRAHCSGVAKIDDHCSFVEAAAVPLAFATSHYSLVIKAGLQKGETVLIHSAAGGVGQTAVQLAKSIGATVFATVGNDEKKKFLINAYDIPETHIFSSRNAEFVDGVMGLTNGKGADVILNSLSGDLFRASWSAIAPLGRFVEIGKSDLASSRGLATPQFLRNVSFIGVDIGVVLAESPTVMRRITRAISMLHRDGIVKISQPLKVFKVGEVETAFRHMQGGRNIGKSVVEMDPGSTVMVIPDARPRYRLKGDATYVVAGGFGGIGQHFIDWMVSRGARNFIVLSRSGDTTKAARTMISRLTSLGVKVVGLACDITNEDQVRSLMERAAKDMLPIKGVIQAAGILHDGLFSNMKLSDWKDVVGPKVAGSWNLHKHLPSGMDFFITTSSIVSWTGSRGQASYAAGNSYLDALVRHRLSLGEHAFSMNIGPVKGVGMLSSQQLEDVLLKDGFEVIEMKDLLCLLEHACDPNNAVHDSKYDNSQIATGFGGLLSPMAKEQSEIYWLQRPFLSALKQYYNEKGTGEKGGDSAGGTDPSTTKNTDLAYELQQIASSDQAATEALLHALRVKLSRAINISIEDVEPSKPVHAFGVDSLVSLEIRYWLMKESKANVTVFDIMGAKSLLELSQIAWKKSTLRPMEGGREDEKVDE